MTNEISPGQPSEPTNVVENDEKLYRSIKLIAANFKLEQGSIRLSQAAFADRSKRTSFFRHKLTEAPPYSNPPRMSEQDAVVALLAGNIRCKISHPAGTGSAKQDIELVIDVVPETIGHHPSHAVAISSPNFPSNGAYEKLKRRLATLVGSQFEIRPDGLFLESLSDS